MTYMYDGDLDWTGHRYGVASPQWELQLSMIDAAAEQLRETLPADVRIVVVADHGMVDSPADRRSTSTTIPELLDGVALLGGEARFRHVYCRAGAVDDVLAAWRERAGRPGRGAHPRRGVRARLVRRGRRRRTAAARRRRRRLPRRLLGDEQPRRSPTRPSWSGCTAR